jgi:hypothetical protein
VGSKIFWYWAIAIISKKLVGNKLWNGGQLPNWPPPGYANDSPIILKKIVHKVK